MKSVLLSAVALMASVSTSALFIPPSAPPHHLSGHQEADLRNPYENGVVGSSGHGGVSVLFPIPCPECSVDTTDELDINLTLESSGVACKSSNIVVNDVRLFPSEGDFTFAVNVPQKQDARATWMMICLEDDVTILSVQIHSIGGVNLPLDTGFSTSFKQINTPDVVRLERVPIQKSKCGTANLQQWARPQKDQEYVVLPAGAAIDNKLSNELQKQLHSLNEIKARIARLHHEYKRQERRVLETIKQDFRACDGATCVFQTAVKKAPEFLELVKAHFQHRPDWKKLHQQQSLFGDHNPKGPRHHNEPASMFGEPHPFDSKDHRPTKPWDMVPDLEHTPFPTPFDQPKPKEFILSSLPPPPPPPGDRHETPHMPPHPPFIPDHDYPPPPHGNDEGQRHRHGEHPPWAGHRGPRPHRPHFLHRHGPHRHPFFFSVGSMVFFVVVASLLFRCVRAKTGLFRDVRRTRDRAACREECRNRAAYKRAAIRHKWGRWWSQFRQPESTADYEEKRTRILDQEEELENVMQSEIRDIRRAHQIVDGIMRAEGSRQSMYHEANFGSPLRTTAPFPDPVRQHTETGQTTDTTLPLYQPPPPSYDQELEEEIMVVDGFNYTPSATDSTAESSDFDCNSVMSYGTGTAASVTNK